MGKLRRWLDRLSLRKRLILMTFLIAVFSAVMIAGMLSVWSSRALYGESARARSELAEFTASSISERFQTALRVCNLSLGQSNIANAMEKASTGAAYPLSEQIHDAWEIGEFFNTLQGVNDLVRVRLLLCGPTLYAQENVHFFRMTEEERAALSALRADGRFVTITEGEFPYIFQNPTRVVTVLYTMDSRNDFLTVIGAVAVDIATDDILARMRGMLVSDRDAVVLYDRSGEPVLSVGDEVNAALPAAGAFGEWSAAGRVLLYDVPLGVDGWILSCRVDRTDMSSQTEPLVRTALLALVAVLLAAFAITVSTSTANSQRILRLAAAMDRVRAGDMAVRVEEGGTSEVGKMEHSFNFLVDELQHTLDSRVEDARLRQELEMRLLQSQIKPHFLYNTLDLICWHFNRAGDVEGARFVQALAQFYRIGLSRGNGLIPLSEELRHVQLYVQIQNFRLDGSIDLEITLPHDCLDIPVPGNILQPLVENSIDAGIREKPDGKGSVRIVCERSGGELVILISDDGVGVDLAAIEAILQGNGKDHYGVWNVHQRLRLLLGPEAGLAYSRNERGGTDVRMRIPFGGI